MIRCYTIFPPNVRRPSERILKLTQSQFRAIGMMIHRKILEELLQQPLGPYRDHDILHETKCQMKGGTQLVLYSFILEHDGHLIGLDESERPLDGQDDRTFRFRGVLKITNPEWLSDFGLKTVETELNLRAQERALREGERQPPQLTLDGLFAGTLLTKSRDSTWKKEAETRLTVLIQGEKNMPATFMRSSLAPNGLLWSSKAHGRTYQVATMDVETYSLSENFFWRWRLLALMEKISKQYPYVPASKRTPIWFVDKYAGYACPPEDTHRRLIFNEDDSDVDENGRTVITRHLLKPHASEILGLFAAQADWLITHNEVKREHLFDISSWKEFAKRVKKERKEAARQGVRWGWAAGQEAEAESSEEGSSMSEEEVELESKVGLAHRLAREQPVIGKTKKILARKLEIALMRPPRDRRASDSSSSGSEGVVTGGAVYASDFSDPSDAEEDDEDEDYDEDKVVDHIPWQLQLPALLPDVDGRWWCPLPQCDYQIDLHELPEEDHRRVPEVGYILQKQWRNAAYDDRVLEGFSYLVFRHYSIHLEKRGVKVETKNGKKRFAFINDRPRQAGGQGPIRGPMPALGTLGGESRVIPTLHAPHAGHFR